MMTEEKKAQIHAHIELEKRYVRETLADIQFDRVNLHKFEKMIRSEERELEKTRTRIKKLQKQLKGK